MKITEIKPILCQGGIKTWTFVKITTDEGIIGWGDATEWVRVKGHVAAIEDLTPLVIGEDPFNIEKIWQKLYVASYVTGKDCSVGITGIETALWDIVGKALNTPVYNLLGGKCNEKVKLYYDYCDSFQTGFLGGTVWKEGDKSIEGIQKQAQKILEKKFQALKMHPLDLAVRPSATRIASYKSMISTAEKVKAIREVVGDNIDILIDINNRLDIPSTIRLTKYLEPYDVLFIEDPIRQEESPESYSRLRKKVKVPIGTGENLYTVWSFRNYLEMDALDYVLLDVCHCGILQAKKIAALAEAFHIPLYPHNPNSPLSTIISGHLMASIPNAGALEYFSRDLEPPWRDSVISSPLMIKDGFLYISDKPGWGVDVIEEETSKHPYKEEAWYTGMIKGREGLVIE
jgi:galactonate dehydratase